MGQRSSGLQLSTLLDLSRERVSVPGGGGPEWQLYGFGDQCQQANKGGELLQLHRARCSLVRRLDKVGPGRRRADSKGHD